jgi:hypothetical protein
VSLIITHAHSSLSFPFTPNGTHRNNPVVNRALQKFLNSVENGHSQAARTTRRKMALTCKSEFQVRYEKDLVTVQKISDATKARLVVAAARLRQDPVDAATDAALVVAETKAQSRKRSLRQMQDQIAHQTANDRLQKRLAFSGGAALAALESGDLSNTAAADADFIQDAGYVSDGGFVTDVESQKKSGA